MDIDFRNQLIELENGLTQLTSQLYCDEPPRTAAAEAAATQAQCLLDLCTHLVGISSIVGAANRVPEADFLLARLGEIERTATPASAAQLAENLPWLLGAALDFLLESKAVDDNPVGPEAITARLLGAMFEVFANDKKSRAQHSSTQPDNRACTTQSPLHARNQTEH